MAKEYSDYKWLNFILFVLLIFCSILTNAGEALFKFGEPNVNLHDKASLQRGARDYMNYCSGCHSLNYIRYKQLALGIGVTDNQKKLSSRILKTNLMFTGEKVTDHVHRSIKKTDAKQWFGVNPPDLSLEYNAKGGKWLYNYLLSFYVDNKRPWGVNNLVYKDVAMPNVLGDLQGDQEAVYSINLKNGQNKEIVDVKLIKSGDLNSTQYKQLINDVVNFLAFVSEPNKLERITTGLYVILFIIVLIVLAWSLKREYWKDIKK